MDTFIKNFGGVLNTLRVVDIIDILAVAFIIYYAIRLVRETRATQLVKSLAVVFVVYFIANYFEMVTLKFFIKNILDVGIIVLVVLFQPELRRALERIGRSRFTDIAKLGFRNIEEIVRVENLINSIVKTCQTLIRQKDGALIVIERDTKLGDIINTGTIIDADPSRELMANLFYKNAPLHDGAMVIRDARVYAAGCLLPLTERDNLGKELGTRHRAAIGVSEISDAIVIVVSEERGVISVVEEGSIKQDLSPKQLESYLQTKLIEQVDKKKIWKPGEKKSEK